VRRAAKYTAYLYLRGKKTIEDKAGDEIVKNAYKGGSSFLENFKQEVRKGLQEEAKKRK